MKGPGLRIDLDVRRVWRCAKCGKTVRTQGLVTAQRCGCSDGAQWMQLQAPVKREPFVPPHRDPIPEDGPDPATTEKVESEPGLPAMSEASSPPAETAGTAPTESAVIETALIETVLIEAVPAEPAADPTSPPAPPPVDRAAKAETAPPPPDEFGAGLTS